MNIFSEVKARIGADTVIADCGVKIGRNGMACCPFHPDKHPSMIVDKNHYHCFGCGAHGDAISFVAQYMGLSQYEAACKIANDYKLTLPNIVENSAEEAKATQIRKQNEAHVSSVKDRFNKWVDEKIRDLKECEKLIREARESFIGTEPGAMFITNGFAYMLHKEPIIGYWLDILCMGDDADKRSLFLEEREEVSRVAANIKRTGYEILGRNRKCAG